VTPYSNPYAQVPNRVLPQPLVISVQARRSLAVAVGSFVFGIALTLAVLALFAPHPDPVRPLPGSADLVIGMDDAFLSQVTAKGLAAAQLPFDVSEVEAHAAVHDQISVTAEADLVLTTSPLHATAQIAVANGYLVVHTTEADVGGLVLPEMVTGAMDDQINQQLAQATQGLLARGARYTLTGVTTTDGSLELVLTPR
jgi:hypothetical protein